ncbi:MAG: gamma-glutamyl-phosphate reductase, partial [Gammaproteobacteria bacterium]|nr:gamma-glutamyl-phosphate reductase [Gammaproteobacteria bacterium]
SAASSMADAPGTACVRKVSVPFGVVGMVYESRPNVTVDAATLALQAGSAAVRRSFERAGQQPVLGLAVCEPRWRGGAPADAVQLSTRPTGR